MNESVIYKKLSETFDPSYLQVKNESHLHKHHSQSPKNGNSHFSVTIKSDYFNKLSSLQRQREVYKALDYEIKNGLHALRIKILD